MGFLSGIRVWLEKLKRANFIYNLSQNTPEQLGQYHDEISKILGTIQQNQFAFLHYATGRAITTWALMEERLVTIASLLLRTSPQKAGLIFYSIINFHVWITIITELFALDQEFAPFRNRWNKLFERLRAEKDNRDRIAHHYVVPSGVTEFQSPIKQASRIDMRAKSQKSATMNIDQVDAFQKRMEAILDDLLKLTDDMLKHGQQRARPASPEKSSEQPPDPAT